MMNPNDTTNRTTQTTPPRTIRPAAAVIAGLTLSAVVLAGCAGQASALGDDLSSVTDATAVTFSYTGTVQQYTVPDGVASLTIVGIGGSGGASRDSGGPGAGAQITGSLAVQPGQQLLVSVGQSGGSASSHDTDPPGGWGGLGANGGNGNAASDTLRTGGAGGGATTIQLANADGTNPQTVLVAGGGGGEGGPSGDPDSVGFGGWAGCKNDTDNPPTPWWLGANGQNGSLIEGGKGGTAGGESGMAGGRGQGGSGLGGNGGGGGGGVNGGSPGSGASGTSAGGGGGAGSSATYVMTNTSINCSLNGGGEPASGDGNVVVTPNPS
jgi:hypothetical protein